MDDEIERFKIEIDLPEFVASYGYRPPRGYRDRPRRMLFSSVLMQHEATHDKIVIRKDVDRHWTYFSVHDAVDNGTVVDFIQYRKSANLGAVRKELREWLDLGRDTLRAGGVTVAPSAVRDLSTITEDYARSSLLEYSAYLRSRGIRTETLQSGRFHGTVRTDRRGNVLFGHVHPIHHDRIGGYEKKNWSFTGFAAGGAKTLWSSCAFDGDMRFVFVEGAIDALSYHQIHADRHTRYFSTGGAVGSSQLEFVGALLKTLPRHSAIVLATDNDVAGESLAKQIAQLATDFSVHRDPSPIGKDWNDCLKVRERDFIRASGVREFDQRDR